MADAKKYRPVSAFFQFVMIIITSIIIGFCLYRSATFFTSNDPSPSLQELTPKRVEQFGGTSSSVATGLYISDFISFDLVKNNIIFTGIIWFEFDPELITLDLISKFKFEGAEILEKSEPDSRIVGDKLLVRYIIKVHLTPHMSYQYFPFDDHRIYLMLVHPLTSPIDMIFNATTSDFDIKAATQAFGWQLHDKQVKAGFIEARVQEQQSTIFHPSVLFSMDYLRSGIRYALTIFLPLLAIFFISMFAFSLDTYKSSTLPITLSAGSVTAILAYRFVIENLSPSVGYFMISDYIYLLCLLVVSLVFTLSIIMKQISYILKKLIVIALHGVIAGAYIYLMLFWMT